ncbi:hypothetical protein T439DRAFT_114720 [Meredithblackwellia eburnea MCA 4105]
MTRGHHFVLTLFSSPLQRASKRNSTVSKSSSSSKSVKDGGPLTKEQKEAKARAALFKEDWDDGGTGGMALARAAASSKGGSSGHSARPMLSGNNSGRDSPRSIGSPVPGQQRATVAKPKHIPSKAHLGAKQGLKQPIANGSGGSVRDRLTAGFDPRSLIALNTEKRDRRTIEEIEHDMRMKKGKFGTPPAEATPPPTARKPTASSAPAASSRPVPASASTLPKRKSGEEARDRDPKRSRLSKEQSSSLSSKPRRKRSSSVSSDSDSEDSYSSDFSSDSEARRRRRKKEKSRRGRGHGEEYDDLAPNMREEIWRLMGRDRRADMRRAAYSDSEDDDMEATGEDLRREERIAYVFFFMDLLKL